MNASASEIFPMLIAYLISASVIGLLAARRNRNGLAWGAIGGLFCLPTLLVLVFMSSLCPKCHGSMTDKEWKQGSCPRCENADKKI